MSTDKIPEQEMVIPVDVAKTFRVDIPGAKMFKFKEGGLNVPFLAPYIFDKEYLKKVLFCIGYKFPLKIYGPTGCGKTSFVEQILARLNWGLYKTSGYEDKETWELIGRPHLKSGETTFLYGPLPLAFSGNCVFLYDEMDVVSPGVNVVCHSALERSGDFVIDQNGGERLKRTPYFRFIATSNTKGWSDETGIYQGTTPQNYATTRRCFALEMDYPKREVEREILATMQPDLPADLIEDMISLAEAVRKGFVNDQLSAPMSTADLIDWSRVAMMMGEAAFKGKAKKKNEEGLRYFEKALEFVFSDHLPTKDRHEVMGLYRIHVEKSNGKTP